MDMAPSIVLLFKNTQWSTNPIAVMESVMGHLYYCYGPHFGDGSSTFSMTTLLTHTVAHSTKPFSRPKTNNQPPKKFLSLSLSWTKVVKNGKILTFKVNFLSQKISESFWKKNSLKNMILGAHFLLLTFFENFNF